jgi:hypothetical protein
VPADNKVAVLEVVPIAVVPNALIEIDPPVAAS